MAWPVVGKTFTPAAFKDYVDSLTWGDGFRPQFLTLHNTAVPSLAQRPAGFTRQHILNLQNYYQGLGWGGGPHLFIDDKQIWVFNDLTKRGTHSPSWNATAIGIEMLGDYECESFTSGRGQQVRANTVRAMAALNNKLGFTADAFRFHIEDTKSNHACPGKLCRCERAALVAEIEATMSGAAEPTGVPVALVGEEDTNGHLSIPAADPPALQPTSATGGLTGRVSGWLDTSDRNYAIIKRLADQGSRIGSTLSRGASWFWRLVLGVGGGGAAVSQLADTSEKGAAGLFVGWVERHPFLFVGICLSIILALVYFFVLRPAIKFLVTAYKDGRYKPGKRVTT